MLLLWVRVNLEAMAIMGHSTFPKSQRLGHEIRWFNVISEVLIGYGFTSQQRWNPNILHSQQTALTNQRYEKSFVPKTINKLDSTLSISPDSSESRRSIRNTALTLKMSRVLKVFPSPQNDIAVIINCVQNISKETMHIGCLFLSLNQLILKNAFLALLFTHISAVFSKKISCLSVVGKDYCKLNFRISGTHLQKPMSANCQVFIIIGINSQSFLEVFNNTTAINCTWKWMNNNLCRIIFIGYEMHNLLFRKKFPYIYIYIYTRINK